METDPVHFFTEFMKSPVQILQSRGVFDCRGEKARPPDRADFQAVLSAHKGSTDRVRFDRLDLSDADLRGLDLSRTSFVGCDLTRADASPLVILDGQELGGRYVQDGFINEVLDRWERGEAKQLKCEGVIVKPTRLRDSLLYGATLSSANFNFALMENCRLREVRAERARFYKADLKGADLRFGNFAQADLRRADVDNANLLDAHIDTIYLGDIRLGEKEGIRQERTAKQKDRSQHHREEDWEDAIAVYRLLARAHERIDMRDTAGEFRYQRNKAQTNLILERGVKSKRAPALRSLRWWVFAFRHGVKKDIGLWILRLFWNLICGFGERPKRPVLCIFFIILAFIPLYFDKTGWDLSIAGFLLFCERLPFAVFFSATSTAGIGWNSWDGEQMEWVKYLRVLQPVFGWLLGGLLLVTVSRRWMR